MNPLKHTPGKVLWQGFYTANWIIIALFWFFSSLSLWESGLAGALIALGRLTGLSAAYMILTQFFLVGRNPWLERFFGLDKLTRLHHENGKRGILLLLFHPLLLVLGYAALDGIDIGTQFLTFLFDYEYVLFAAVGLTLFAVVAVTSLYIARSRFRYEAWYGVHLLVYLAVFLSFWHQIEVGGTLSSSQLFYGYWISLYIFVFANHIIFRFARPLYLFEKHRFEVERIERQSPTSVSVYISGVDLKKFPVRPGQFMILRFLTKGRWWQAHPFSLSKPTDGNVLRITVKELGDFTKGVKDIPLGTKVLIDGPYGVFTDFFGISSKVLLIAGGIGITPIRSLLEEMLSKGRDVTLLYASRVENDIIFYEEIEALRKKYPTRVIYVLSEEPGYQGETGYIDEEKIKRLVPDVTAREVYVCGPLPMMDSLVATLRHLGVPTFHIHHERFSL